MHYIFIHSSCNNTFGGIVVLLGISKFLENIFEHFWAKCDQAETCVKNLLYVMYFKLHYYEVYINRNTFMHYWLYVLGHPRWMGYVGDFWQNVVHWRREWQTTSVFLPWEPNKRYERGKIYDTERWTPQGFKITGDGVCSHEIKRDLFLGRKAIKNL